MSIGKRTIVVVFLELCLLDQVVVKLPTGAKLSAQCAHARPVHNICASISLLGLSHVAHVIVASAIVGHGDRGWCEFEEEESGCFLRARPIG